MKENYLFDYAGMKPIFILIFFESKDNEGNVIFKKVMDKKRKQGNRKVFLVGKTEGETKNIG